MTLRRLFVLIRGLPAESWTKVEARRAHEQSLKPTPEQIRSRAEHYRRQREAG